MIKDKISIVIPALNEAEQLYVNLPGIIERTQSEKPEIIVVDGGSNDKTVDVARSFGCKVIQLDQANRAKQMNAGAEHSEGEILFFVHADSLPPEKYDKCIKNVLLNGAQFGMFAYRFSPSNWLLQINAYFTQFDGLFTGGGDQGLFIRKGVFKSLGSYDESMPLFEDYDFFQRAKVKYKYEICPERMTVSSRKYKNNAYLKVQLVNLYTFLAYKRDADLNRLANRYKKWIK